MSKGCSFSELHPLGCQFIGNLNTIMHLRYCLYMKLTDFKVLTFDVYGTLVDWETGIVDNLKPITEKASLSLSSNEILEAHAVLESSAQRDTPTKCYGEILAHVYKCLAETWKVSVTPEECYAYGASVADWPPFGDSVEALVYLKNFYKLVVLSNVDNCIFHSSKEKLKVSFDAIYISEDIGSYKPDVRNFEYMIENLSRLGIKKNEILHTAESMFHDLAPAHEVGLASCWIYRRYNQQGFGATMDPGIIPTYDLSFNSMADLVKAHKAEILDGTSLTALQT